MPENSCKITVEHHAVLYALLAREAILAKGEDGRKTILKATHLYGWERGRRMAEAARLHGDEPTVSNYMVYGEWKSETGNMRMDPDFTGHRFGTRVTRCDWCDFWERHGLTEYGKCYCLVADVSIYEGYNEDLSLHVGTLLSGGNDCCTFDWGEGITPEEARRMGEKKAALGDSCIRDFAFHTGHIYYTVGGFLIHVYGEEGRQMVERACAEFERRFGPGLLPIIKSYHV